jgi:hypothetical protein
MMYDIKICITLAPGQFPALPRNLPATFPQLKSRDELQINQSDLGSL